MTAIASEAKSWNDQYFNSFTDAPSHHAVKPATSLQIEHGNADARGNYDVIILGGGFCGVTAARECRKKGLRTLLLEARDRFGGRTFSAIIHGEPHELGGTWVHWSQPHFWAEKLRYGIELVETPGATAPKMVVRTRDQGIVELETAKEWDALEAACAAYMGPTREVYGKPHEPFSGTYKEWDISGQARLNSLNSILPIHKDILDGLFATCGGAHHKDFTLLDMMRWYAIPGHNLTDLCDAVTRYRMKDGTASLLNAMLQDAKPDTRLSCPVKRVEQDVSGVRVVTRDGEEFTARAVVSAVPLNCLGDIEWLPGISAGKQAVSKQKHAAICAKVHVMLEGDVGNIGCVAPSEFGLNWLFTEHQHGNMTHMVGFGPEPNLLDGKFKERISAAVKEFLPNARVVEALGYSWHDDPYSQGTWCVFKPGQYAYLEELQKDHGRVIFASADWANGWRGFIDGAIEQGIAAGHRVAKLLH
jgi:pseudooxynicotine oxidase